MADENLTVDTSHLVALHERLSRERARYEKDTSPLRKVWIDQTEREIAAEVAFLRARGWTGDYDPTPSDMSDEDLLSALSE